VPWKRDSHGGTYDPPRVMTVFSVSKMM
jgi:hypothetical protein